MIQAIFCQRMTKSYEQHIQYVLEYSMKKQLMVEPKILANNQNVRIA